MLTILLISLIYLLDFINSLPTEQRYARYAHSSALVDDKLYFMCGYYTNNMFYLDLSKSFADSLPLVDIPSNLPVNGAWQTASVGGRDNTTIFLFGGLLRDVITGKDVSNDLVFTFSSPNGPWQRPSISGTPPNVTPRAGVESVIDENGKMYLFGGDNGAGEFNNMYILDTINLMWSNGGDADLVFKRTHATSVLLKNGEILYIGGYSNSATVDINTVLVYNTKSLKWSTTTVVGDIIDARSWHTAVLAPDGKVIIYGGANMSEAMSKPAMVLLDTNSSSYSWSIPKIPPNPPPPLMRHSANLVGNYMIVAFGLSSTGNQSNEIYLFDIHTYTWVTTFYQQSNSSASPSESPNPPSVTTSQTSETSQALSNDARFINSLPTDQHYARYAHASALIDNKLYVMCGVFNTALSKNFFYLDLSKSFTDKLPPLVDVISNFPVKGAWLTASAGGHNNTTIFLFGGILQDAIDNNDLIFAFPSPDGPWQRLPISGTPPIGPRAGVKSVIDENGKMYLFGGDNGGGVTTNNNMYILDTINLMWSNGGDADPAFRRTHAPGVLLKSGEILYIGGYTDKFTTVDINTVLVYNTKSSKWSATTAVGDVIQTRFYHTAVLAPDGKIIIYGGANTENGTMSEPAMVLLDTNNSPYSWSIPNIPSNPPPPPPLMQHTANLVGNYMIVAFGSLSLFTQSSSEIYLFDTHTYTWVTRFDQQSNSSTTTNSIGVGATLGAIILIGAVAFLIYHYYKKKKIENVYPTAGSNMAN
nr:2017_t:CDS:10 [Entrophospora candida]